MLECMRIHTHEKGHAKLEEETTLDMESRGDILTKGKKLFEKAHHIS